MSPYPAPATPAGGRPPREPLRCELADPAAVLSAIDRLVSLRPGVLMALVRQGRDQQHLERVVPLDWPRSEASPGDLQGRGLDQVQQSELLRRAALRLWGRRSTARRGVPTRTVVLVSVRRGRVVFGPVEDEVLGAWRYANHLLPVWWGDLLLVTEHGWRTLLTDRGGRSPALLESAPA